MKIWRFEGSPEEFQLIAKVLMADDTASTVNSLSKSEKIKPEIEDPSKPAVPANGRVYVTAAQAKEVLTRREISEPMANVLRALHNAGEQRLKSEQLMKLNEHSSDQFRGLMGAFGRRLVNTVGTETWFFDDKWDHTSSQNTYRLSPEAHGAVGELMENGEI